MTAAAQIRVWANDRGLWHDELYIAVNLQKPSYVELAGGLYWNQTAPPGWLIVQRAIVQLVGTDEQWLRLPQLLSGLALLVMVLVAGLDSMGRWGALLAVGAVGGNPMILYYAGELKQYSVEALMAMVMLVALVWFSRRLLCGQVTWRQIVIVGAVGVLAMGGSYTALLVLGGALAGMLVVLAAARLWRDFMIALLAALPGLVLGACQVLLRHRFGFLRDQDSYFKAGLPPADGGPGGVLAWLPRMGSAFVDTPIRWQFPAVVLLLALGGFAALCRRGERIWAAALAGVVLASLAAAAVRAFPMAERVSLYLIAPLMLLVAAGVQGAVHLIREPRSTVQSAGKVGVAVIAVVAVAWAATPAIADSVRQVRDPLIVAPYQGVQGDRSLDNGRALIREVKAHWQPGDVVLAYWYTQPLVSWYAPQYDLPITGYVNYAQAGGCARSDGLPATLGDASRVFYVHLELLSYHPATLNALVLNELQQRGPVVESHVFGPGSIREQSPSWTLIDLTRPALSTASPNANTGCLAFDKTWK